MVALHASLSDRPFPLIPGCPGRGCLVVSQARCTDPLGLRLGLGSGLGLVLGLGSGLADNGDGFFPPLRGF